MFILRENFTIKSEKYNEIQLFINKLQATKFQFDKGELSYSDEEEYIYELYKVLLKGDSFGIFDKFKEKEGLDDDPAQILLV